MNDRKNVCYRSYGEISKGIFLDTAGYCLDDSEDRYEVVLTEGMLFGKIFLRQDSFGEHIPVTDPKVIARVLALQAEDAAIDAARDAMAQSLADRLHDGNALAVTMFRSHLEFEGSLELFPVEHEGISFYQVGRNASHEFYLGLKDGQAYCYSCGEG